MTAPLKTVPLLVLCALALAAPPTASAAAGDVIVRYAPGTEPASAPRCAPTPTSAASRPSPSPAPRSSRRRRAPPSPRRSPSLPTPASRLRRARRAAQRASRARTTRLLPRSGALPIIDATTAWDDGDRRERCRPSASSTPAWTSITRDLVDNIVQGGWDFVGNDAEPQDGDGHGTHVAGTSAPRATTASASAASAWEASILPMRVLDDRGRGSRLRRDQRHRRRRARGARVVVTSRSAATRPSTPSAPPSPPPRTSCSSPPRATTARASTRRRPIPARTTSPTSFASPRPTAPTTLAVSSNYGRRPSTSPRPASTIAEHGASTATRSLSGTSMATPARLRRRRPRRSPSARAHRRASCARCS